MSLASSSLTSTPLAPHTQALLTALRAAGFTDAKRQVELGIFSAYTARRPG